MSRLDNLLSRLDNVKRTGNGSFQACCPEADVLRAIGFEVLFVAAVEVAILDRDEFSASDRDRLILAVSRIQSAMAAAGLDNEKSRSTVVQFPAKEAT